jgi:hypothetical protein
MFGGSILAYCFLGQKHDDPCGRAEGVQRVYRMESGFLEMVLWRELG